MKNDLFSDAALMITGGTGSFGNTVLKHFLHTDIGEIRIFSRDEKKQDDMRHELQAKYPDRAKKVKFYIGNVRNPQSVHDAMPGVDFVLHAAIEAGVKRVVCLSIDKAAYPINAMGTSKAMMEHVVKANARVAADRGNTIICSTRYGEEYTVNDPNTELELLYIDDLIEEMLDALEGHEHRCEYNGLGAEPDSNRRYCYVPAAYHMTLGEIAALLESFKSMPAALLMPELPEDSFAKKLYSAYLSYLPEYKMSYSLKSNVDSRGNFTELIRTFKCGQVSINVLKPGITRGQHWHNSKCEIFIVVSGQGLIQERQVGVDPETGKPYPVIEFEVTGEQMKAVQILPGYTHNIINLSKTENLVTVMWANEPFEEERAGRYIKNTIKSRHSAIQ